MDRITNNDLESLVQQINKATDSPLEPWTRNEHGRTKANARSYYIAGAYGGVKLERMCNDGRGCTDISTDGYGTKRQLYTWMRAFLAGLATKV